MVLNAQPPLEELRPLFQNAHRGDMIALAWCQAIVAVHTSELQNCLLYDHNTPEQSLLKKLFHVNVGGEFTTTRHEPFCYLTNNSIELLMNHLENHSGSTAEVGLDEAQALSATFNKEKKNLIKNKPLKELIGAVRTVPNMLYVAKALLGYAYLKAQTLSDFYRSINTSFQESDYKWYQEWAQTISKKNSDSIFAQNISDFLYNNTPLIIYAKLKQRQHLPSLPPKLYYADATPDPSLACVRDCCETLIQEFINRLLYNAHTQQFELSRASLSCRLHPVCVGFYQKFNSAKTIQELNDDVRRNAWIKLISSIPGAVYRKSKNGISYEVHPSVKNFNHIFMYLIGAAPLQCGVILDRLRIKNFPLNDTHTDIQFGLATSSTQEQTFTVHIREGHAWITDDNQTVKIVQTTSTNANTYTHEQEILKQILVSDDTVLRQIFGFALPVEKITDPQEQKTLLFSHQTETDGQKYRLLRKLLQCTKTNTALLTCACNVIRDIYYSESIKNALMRCIERRMQSNQEIKRLLLEKISLLDSLQKQQLLLCMAQHDLHTDSEYNHCMKQFIAQIPDTEISDDEKLIIDTKVYTLARLLKTNVVYDNDIMDSIERQIMELDFERFEKLQRVMNGN